MKHHHYGRDGMIANWGTMPGSLCFLIGVIIVGFPTLCMATTVDCRSIISWSTTYFRALTPTDSFTIADCHLQQSTVFFFPFSGGGALDIQLHNLTLEGGIIHIRPETAGQPVESVAVRIIGSRIYADDLAVFVSSTVLAENISVTVEDSTITAEMDIIADAHVVTVSAPTASYVTLRAIRSVLRAVRRRASVLALSVIATDSDHVELHCGMSSVLASGPNMANAMSLHSSGYKINASNFVIIASFCNISAVGKIPVASMGLSCLGASSTNSATNFTMAAEYSNVSAVGGDSIVCMGMNSVSASSSTSNSASNFVMSAVHSTVSATGTTSVASMGMNSYCTLTAPSSSTVAVNFVMTAISSTVAAIGTTSVACMGLNAVKGSPSTINATNFQMKAVSSAVSAVGTSLVSCMGLSSFSYNKNSNTASNFNMSASSSNVTAVGKDWAVSCMGMSTHGSSGYSENTATNFNISAVSSTVGAVGTNVVGCMGFCAYTSAGRNSATDFSINVVLSNVTAEGGLYCVACVGLSATCEAITCANTATNSAISAAHSTISSSGTYSVSSMGLASYIYGYSSGGSISNTASTLTIRAAFTNVAAAGTGSVAAMGVKSGFMGDGIATNTLSGAVSFLGCGSSFHSTGSLFGASPPLTDSEDVRWVVLCSDLHSDGDGCLNCMPQGADSSVLRSVDIWCAVPGTGYSVSGQHFAAPYGSNVLLNGQSLNATGINDTFSFMVSDPSSGPFQGSYLTSCPAIFNVPSFDWLLPHGVAIATPSHTRLRSSSGSLSATRSRSLSAPPQEDSFTYSSTASQVFLPGSPTEHLLISESLTLSSISFSESIHAAHHLSPTAEETIITESATISALLLNADDANTSSDHQHRSRNPAVSTLVEILSPEAANALVITGVVSTAVSGAFSPSVATHYARVGAVLRSVLCILSEEEDSPSYIEHPLWLPIGSGKMPNYTGACLSDVVIVIVFCLVPLALWKVMRKEDGAATVMGHPMKHIVKFVGIASPLVLAYFLPNISSSSSILLFTGGASGVEVVVAIIGAVVWFSAIAWPLWATMHLPSHVKWSPADKAKSKIEFRYYAVDEKSLFVETHAGYFYDTKNPDSMWCRLLYFEEVICSSLCAFLSGIRPKADRCVYVLIAILVVAVAHTIFAVAVQPFNRKLGNFFSVLSAVTTLCIGGFGIAVANDPSNMHYVAYPLFIQNVFFFLQTACECCWVYVVSSKRRVLRAQAAVSQSLLQSSWDADDGNAAELQSCEIVDIAAAPTPARRPNPLTSQPV